MKYAKTSHIYQCYKKCGTEIVKVFFSEYKMHRVLIKYVQLYRGNGDDFRLNLKNLDVGLNVTNCCSLTL